MRPAAAMGVRGPAWSASGSRGPRDPRVTGLRRHARILVTGWVLCVLPLLSVGLAYLLLHLPGINRALWRAGNWQAHLTSAAVISHRYATAVIDVLGLALLALSFAGSSTSRSD